VDSADEEDHHHSAVEDREEDEEEKSQRGAGGGGERSTTWLDTWQWEGAALSAAAVVSAAGEVLTADDEGFTVGLLPRGPERKELPLAKMVGATNVLDITDVLHDPAAISSSSERTLSALELVNPDTPASNVSEVVKKHTMQCPPPLSFSSAGVPCAAAEFVSVAADLVSVVNSAAACSTEFASAAEILIWYFWIFLFFIYISWYCIGDILPLNLILNYKNNINKTKKL
jgi:hypothetical protein